MDVVPVAVFVAMGVPHMSGNLAGRRAIALAIF